MLANFLAILTIKKYGIIKMKVDIGIGVTVSNSVSEQRK